MLLLISYDLDAQGARPANYEQIRERITSSAIEARRALYSQWLVVTDDSPAAWVERLRDLLTPADRLFVVRVTGSPNGWLPADFWEWINSHV